MYWFRQGFEVFGSEPWNSSLNHTLNLEILNINAEDNFAIAA